MKKIIAIFCATALFAASAGAQNILGGILNAVGGGNVGETITNVIAGVTGASTDLVGSWTYGGVAAAVRSDNILSTVAGNAAVSTLENKADEILGKAGVTPGAATFTFNQDGTFSFQAGRLPAITGTYVQEGNSVSFSFGKMLKFLKLKGTVSAAAGGCKILFDGERFMTFAQRVIEFANKITTSAGLATVGNILTTAKSVDAGFKLTR
jgi:hypothetical protein